MNEFLVALGLVLAIEGGLYAAFPGAMKRMLLLVMDLPEEQLRIAGLTAAITGVVVVWLVKSVLG